jgi:hypothetical protein
MPYTKTQQTEGTLFIVTPEPKPEVPTPTKMIGGCLLVFVSFILMMALFNILGLKSYGIAALLGLVVGIILVRYAQTEKGKWLNSFMMPGFGLLPSIEKLFPDMGKLVNEYRVSTQFLVKPTSILMNQKEYAKTDIQRILVKNHTIDMIERKEFSASTIRPNNPMTNHSAMSAYATDKWRKNVLPVSYRVDIESNGNVITLGGGLTEAAAHGILTDVKVLLQIQ